LVKAAARSPSFPSLNGKVCGLHFYQRREDWELGWQKEDCLEEVLSYEDKFLTVQLKLSYIFLAVLKDRSVTWELKNVPPSAAVENIGQLVRARTRILWR